MRYTVIDGEKYIVESCMRCPFSILDLDFICNYPGMGVVITDEYGMDYRCPLRECE